MTPDETTRVFKMLGDIKGLLLGTYENPEGVVAKVEKHEKWIDKQRKSKEGFVNYAYKVCLAILIAFIAVKTGLK